MNKLLISLFINSSLLLCHASEVQSSKCVSTTSEFVFLIKDVRANAEIYNYYPSVVFSEANKPVGLEWLPLKADIQTSSQTVGYIHGREIRRFVFRWRNDRLIDDIICIWLGLQTALPSGGKGYRPFIVYSGEGGSLEGWDTYCGYNEQDGFTAHLNIRSQGTGRYWDNHTIGFKHSAPIPLHTEHGSRRIEKPEVREFR